MIGLGRRVMSVAVAGLCLLGVLGAVSAAAANDTVGPAAAFSCGSFGQWSSAPAGTHFSATAVLGSIQAPTLITFGRHDLVTSTRFAAPLSAAIGNSEVVVFEDCSHAPIYENIEGFNGPTLDFLQHHSG